MGSNTRGIPLIMIMGVLTLALTGCGNTSKSESDIPHDSNLAMADVPTSIPPTPPPTQAIMSSTQESHSDLSQFDGKDENEKNDLQNWRELYQIPYKISCMDDRLGDDTVRKFQTGERAPTTQERESIKSCETEPVENDSREESADDGGQPKDEDRKDRDEKGDLQDWRELYQIPYKTSCMDDRLGDETVRKFQTGERAPTTQERESIRSCETEPVDSDSREGSVDGGKGQDDQGGVALREKWDPSPDRVACYFSAIGKSSYRAIRAGERRPTNEEIDVSRRCVDGTRTLNHVPHSLANEQCSALELWSETLVKDRPRWDQLECHMKDLQRLSIPGFRTSARVNPVVLWTPPAVAGCNGTMCPGGIAEVVYGLWDGDIDELLDSMQAPTWQRVIKGGPNRYLDIMRALEFTEAEFPDANASFLPAGDVPPHTDELGETLATPLSDYWYDQRLRGYAVHAIQRKQEGHLTFFTSTVPPSTPPVPASGPADFRVWIDEVYIPRKIQEAKFVEKLKIEMWSPWAPEVDVMIMEQPWAGDVSDSELLDTGQYLLNAVADAVRPYYNGRIVPPSFTPGQLRHPAHPRAIWRELSFQGFEEVSFTFFPHCDEETTRKNLLHDVSVVMDIVERDGISWSLGDWWFLDGRPNECESDYYQVAGQITSSMLDILFEQAVPPVGGPVYGLGNIYSTEHKAVLEQGFFARSKQRQ